MRRQRGPTASRRQPAALPTPGRTANPARAELEMRALARQVPDVSCAWSRVGAERTAGVPRVYNALDTQCADRETFLSKPSGPGAGQINRRLPDPARETTRL